MKKIPLTPKEINEATFEKVFNFKSFVLNPLGWEKLRTDLFELFKNGQKFKFDDSICKKLPTSKGIYIFYVEPEFPFTPETRYLLYVGRVIKTDTFRNRFYKYVDGIGKIDQRSSVMKLTNLWPGKTWVVIYPLDVSDNEISDIEQHLIDNIVPPLNVRIKSKGARNAVSLYN